MHASGSHAAADCCTSVQAGWCVCSSDGRPSNVLSLPILLHQQRTKRSKFLGSGLSAAQASLPATKRAKWVGCAVGMAVGCLLGLVPLLFMDTEAAHQANLQRKMERSAAEGA